LNKAEILEWSNRYNQDHPWWIEKENELGDKLREKGELTRGDLVEIVEWKFKTLPGRKKRILGLIQQNGDAEIRSISREALRLTSRRDFERITYLCRIHGVGPALASTIMTFYDPKNYGVFDIHVWRELFGKETTSLFTPRNYERLLSKLRGIAKRCSLHVRVVEKALFKRNLERG